MTTRVMVVDDSPICRETLCEILTHDGTMTVVGQAATGLEALAALPTVRPDVVTLDLDMPGMHGLNVIEQIMARFPVPVLVVTADPQGGGGALVFEAVRRGALDVSLKPDATDPAAAAALRAKVKMLSHIPVVRHVAGHSIPQPARVLTPGVVRPPVELVGVASSAGGPVAVANLLAALPAIFGATVAVAQHLPGAFVDGFARFLQQRCQLSVCVVTGPTAPVAATVYLAAPGAHLLASRRGTLTIAAAAERSGPCPSADMLLASLASHYGSVAAGVVLSGIGSDGAKGLAALRACGALTLVQDQASSLVYGMPQAALPWADRALPVGEIAHTLIQAARKGGAS